MASVGRDRRPCRGPLRALDAGAVRRAAAGAARAAVETGRSCGTSHAVHGIDVRGADPRGPRRSHDALVGLEARERPVRLRRFGRRMVCAVVSSPALPAGTRRGGDGARDQDEVPQSSSRGDASKVGRRPARPRQARSRCAPGQRVATSSRGRDAWPPGRLGRCPTVWPRARGARIAAADGARAGDRWPGCRRRHASRTRAPRAASCWPGGWRRARRSTRLPRTPTGRAPTMRPRASVATPPMW